MGNRAAAYALILERIGRKVLKALQGLPENAFHWVPPLPVCHLLLDDATELITAAEFWINTVIGRHRAEHIVREDLLVVLYTHGERSYLIARYERWLHTLHEILDEVPDAQMETVIVLPPFHRAALSEGPMTIGDGLLHLIQHSACQQGKIQLLCQIYTEAMDLAGEDHLLQTSGEQRSDGALFPSSQEAET